jgi:hypothetical protein
MCRSDPQYLLVNVREAKCTRLGYGTRLSWLYTLDPLLALAFLGAAIQQQQTLSKKITKEPQISHRYLKQTRLRQDCTTQA